MKTFVTVQRIMPVIAIDSSKSIQRMSTFISGHPKVCAGAHPQTTSNELVASCVTLHHARVKIRLHNWKGTNTLLNDLSPTYTRQYSRKSVQPTWETRAREAIYKAKQNAGTGSFRTKESPNLNSMCWVSNLEGRRIFSALKDDIRPWIQVLRGKRLLGDAVWRWFENRIRLKDTWKFVQ